MSVDGVSLCRGASCELFKLKIDQNPETNLNVLIKVITPQFQHRNCTSIVTNKYI